MSKFRVSYSELRALDTKVLGELEFQLYRSIQRDDYQRREEKTSGKKKRRRPRRSSS